SDRGHHPGAPGAHRMRTAARLILLVPAFLVAPVRSGETAPPPATPSPAAPAPAAPAADAASDGSARTAAPAAPKSGLDFLSNNGPPEVRREQERTERQEELLAQARSAQAAAPSDPDALNRLVDVLLLAQEGDEALQRSQAFVTAHPDSAGGFLALGKALNYKGNYDLSLLQFQRASGLQSGGGRDAAFWQARGLSTQGHGRGARR